MKDIYVRGIFVEFGGGISSALVGDVPAVDPKISGRDQCPSTTSRNSFEVSRGRHVDPV